MDSSIPTIQETAIFPYATVTPDKLKRIDKKMAEINRSLQSFSKRNTQTDLKLKTLTLLSIDSPYRTLRQISAQIQNKKNALHESYFDVMLKRAEVEELKQKDDKVSAIHVARLECIISSASASFEAALKDIGTLQETYDEVREANNIPDNWDEADMEAAEVSFNIKAAFRNGIRDFIATGRLGHGTQEWFEQFGIHPMEAAQDINKHLEGNCDYDSFLKFLQDMAAKYSESYKKVMQMLGIKSLVSAEWLYTEEKNG